MISKVLVALCVLGACLADDNTSGSPVEGKTVGGLGGLGSGVGAPIPYPYAQTYHSQDGGYSFEVGSPGGGAGAVPPLPLAAPYSWPLVAASGSWVAVALKGVFWLVQNMVVLAVGGLLLLGFCKLTPYCHKLHTLHSLHTFHKYHKLSEVDLARAQEAVDKAVHQYENNQDVSDEDLKADE